MTSQDYDLLIEHLRGWRDIVINTQHGGFGLSQGAQIAYLERSQIPYRLVDRDDRHSNQRYGPMIMVNGKHWYDKDIPRDDHVLVALVRELGLSANGEHARLKVVRVPANVDWQIEDYDGREWISEQHRTWD
jgi:uncharacterized protein involved in tellurium resistance